MVNKSLLIKAGRVIDPASGLDAARDILVRDGLIKKVAESIDDEAQITIEAKGKIILPGLIDMHVHLREPGREDKETVFSGSKAALAGGVTTVLAMANTNPTIDSPQQLRALNKTIKETAWMKVLPAAAITKAREGRELTDLSALKKEGAVAISDDGCSVDDPGLMRQALIQAKKQDLLVVCHCEDESFSRGGSVNLGFTSTRLGLRGISNESEYQRVKRDIELAKETGARVHIAHVSCKQSVEIIAKAKQEGIKVTAETAPHYFSLTEKAVLGFDTNAKMNPPLRSQEDLDSIKQGLKSGAIDAIASDHAPHTPNEKDIEFDRAAFGVIGLETELSVAITELVDNGLLSWSELIEKMALNPARILGLGDKGSLKVGAGADIVIVSPKEQWTVTKDKFMSKSKNSCFLGRRLKGLVDYTISQGKVAYKR